jgi:hypothetical protein
MSHIHDVPSGEDPQTWKWRNSTAFPCSFYKPREWSARYELHRLQRSEGLIQETVNRANIVVRGRVRYSVVNGQVVENIVE